MTTRDAKSLIFCAFLLLVVSGCGSDNLKSSLETVDQGGGLDWPEVTSQTRPWSRWWWMGSILDQNDLAREMEKYAAAGLGGLEITPIYGVKGREDRFIPYLNSEWMDTFEFTLKQADRLGMGIDMATGNGWPFGGNWVGADTACRNIQHRTFTLKAGQRLETPVTFMQTPMVRAVGQRLSIDQIQAPISSNPDLQGLALEQVRFKALLPLQVLMAYSDQGDTLDLTRDVNDSGMLDWVAPEGDWTLYALFLGWHGKMVERAGPGGEGNVIDHFSKDALKAYLRHFDKAYKGHRVKSLRAYFNDSYEVDDASGESNWTEDLLDEFKKRRGYDLRQHLAGLFGPPSSEGLRVLCDYRETISDLLLEDFTEVWRDWSARKGALVRNQAHGSPANILDLYAASGIPETEGADRIKFKFASSAAHVTGKPLVSSEAATWMDEHFQGTLGTAKQWIDGYLLGGVNHNCYHGTTYSPPGEPWPGWMFYASVHFGPTNSFWTDFAKLNQYVTRCQSFMQAGRPDNDVLLYYPIHDTWSARGRSLLQHFDGSATGTTVRSLGEAMLGAGYTFDFISDRQLAQVKFKSGVLETGGNQYKTVMVPKCQFMPIKTLDKLMTLAEQGATVLIHNQLPTDVPGLANLDRRRTAFSEQMSRLNFTENATGVQQATIGKGKVLLGNALNELLSLAKIEHERMSGSGLKFERRRYEQGRLYFVNNAGDRPVNQWVPLTRQPMKAVALFDPMTEESGLGVMHVTARGIPEVYLQLHPGQSIIIKTLNTEPEGSAFVYSATSNQAVTVPGPWSLAFVSGGPELPDTVDKASLGSWTDLDIEGVKEFSGTAEYEMVIPRPSVDSDFWWLDLGKVCDSARVRLNGQEIGAVLSAPYRVRIPQTLLKPLNVLTIEVSNSMANRMADLDRKGGAYKTFYNVNFPARKRENRGSDGLFTAVGWSPRESGLIGPVRLVPASRLQPR
ncbi:MAG: glycoside hydrolase family 2 protein [Phycisphaeraceae bacterium]|nr:glycoside hydrolase family 2 protein [Phycisphaeraceae bacterium]